MNGDIVFDHVNFGYSDSSEVLKDVSFTVKAGTTFGILGATGSGKSTLMYLLDRLYELPEGCGTITVGGVDIRKIDLDSSAQPYRHSPAGAFPVLQNFPGEHLGRRSPARRRDGAPLRTAGCHRRRHRKTSLRGYDTPIGERGVTISGGQKQRVAIARMLMQDTPHQGVRRFHVRRGYGDRRQNPKSIQHNVHGTTILIAHRITTLMNADQIMVLDHGEVVQLGTHQSSLSAGRHL